MMNLKTKAECPTCGELSPRHSTRTRNIGGKPVSYTVHRCPVCKKFFTLCHNVGRRYSIFLIRKSVDQLVGGNVAMRVIADKYKVPLSTLSEWKQTRLKWISKHLDIPFLLTFQDCTERAKELGVEGPKT